MSDIRFSDEPPPLINSGANILCVLCTRLEAQYTCPKCSVPYCSLQCYRCPKHSECSEKFYQQNVRDELSSRKVTPEEQEAMLHLLSEELDYGKESDDLYSRMEGLDLDTESDEVWSRLTEKEREEFKNTMGRFVPAYKAWWNDFELIKVESDNCEIKYPMLHHNIQYLRDIFKGKPSDSLKFDVINVLYAYVSVHRMYNGDFDNVEEQVAQSLVEISLVLKDGKFSDLSECLDHPAMTIFQIPDLEWKLEFVYSFYREVIKLISHQNLHSVTPYVLYCLSDLYNVFEKSLKMKKKSEEGKKLKRSCSLAQKKLYFFLCWAREYQYLLQELCNCIELECQAKLILCQNFNVGNQPASSTVNMSGRKTSNQNCVQEMD